MGSRMKYVAVKTVALLGLSVWLTACAMSQAINVDLDVGTGDPEQGNGAPSSSFGGAASQPGFWNRVQFGAASVPLLDSTGAPTAVVMSVDYFGFGSGVGFRNKLNTGDYALLLNDALQVGVLSSGGAKEFFFTGLTSGSYQVYTYSVHPAGHFVSSPIYVEQASQNHKQIVTGPMPGNSFEYLITHSAHDVNVGPEGFSVYVEQPPALSNSMYVNGFQIVPVPETNSMLVIIAACSLLLIRKRKRQVRCLASRGARVLT